MMSEPSDSKSQSYEHFIRLFTHQEAGLRAFVRSLIPGREHADEIMQETSVVLWRKFASFDPSTDFLAWACTIARFEVLNYRRRLARDRHVFHVELLEVLADEAASGMEGRRQELQALDRCIQRLAPRQRELVTACYASGMTIKEVAEKMGRSATSLYKALNRIRIDLLECIEASVAGEAHS
jgi:RNA polymerase sigma-70 factor (ECF subfamily)